MMLWLSVSVIKKTNKAALDTQKGASLGLKCVRMRLAAGLRPHPLGKLERSPRPSSRNWGTVPTSKGEGREENGKKKEGDGKGEVGTGGDGGKRRTPVPGCESAKVATLKCAGPPTMPEENRCPWSKKFENRWCRPTCACMCEFREGNNYYYYDDD